MSGTSEACRSAASSTWSSARVRFGRPVAVGGRNTHYQAHRYSLPGRDLAPLDRPGSARRTPTSSEYAVVIITVIPSPLPKPPDDAAQAETAIAAV